MLVVELGETIEDGLLREVREETGLQIAVGQLTGVYKYMVRGIIALVFRCRITGGSLVTTEETAGYRWAIEDDVRDLGDEAYAIRVLDAPALRSRASRPRTRREAPRLAVR